MAKHKKKQFKLLRMLLSLIVLAAVVLAAYIAVRCEGDLSWDNIERTVKNLRADVRSAERFEYDAEDGALFADLDGGLLQLSSSGAVMYSGAGDEIYSEKLRLQRPAMHAVNGRAAAYGVGGTEVRVFDGAGLAYELKTDYEIVSASLSAGGKLALCTKDEGWNGSVSVYGVGGKAVYKWYCASGYPSVAAVSKDGNSLAVLVMSSGGSEIVLLKLDSEYEKARVKLENELAADLRFLDGGNLAVLTDLRLVILKNDGSMAGELSLEGRYVSAYSMESGDMTALVLSDHLGGAQEIVTVGASGQAIAELSATGSALDISARGSRTAVLYEASAVIYKKDLTPEVTLLLGAAAERIIMRADGSALIVGEYSAEALEP